MPELITDPRYAKNRARIERADELEALLAEWIAKHDFHDIEKRLVGAKGKGQLLQELTEFLPTSR